MEYKYAICKVFQQFNLFNCSENQQYNVFIQKKKLADILAKNIIQFV